MCIFFLDENSSKLLYNIQVNNSNIFYIKKVHDSLKCSDNFKFLGTAVALNSLFQLNFSCRVCFYYRYSGQIALKIQTREKSSYGDHDKLNNYLNNIK